MLAVVCGLLQQLVAHSSAATGDQPGHVHLRKAGLLSYAALRHVLEEAQIENGPLALRELAQLRLGRLAVDDRLVGGVGRAEEVGEAERATSSSRTASRSGPFARPVRRAKSAAAPAGVGVQGRRFEADGAPSGALAWTWAGV